MSKRAREVPAEDDSIISFSFLELLPELRGEVETFYETIDFMMLAMTSKSFYERYRMRVPFFTPSMKYLYKQVGMHGYTEIVRFFLHLQWGQKGVGAIIKQAFTFGHADIVHLFEFTISENEDGIYFSYNADSIALKKFFPMANLWIYTLKQNRFEYWQSQLPGFREPVNWPNMKSVIEVDNDTCFFEKYWPEIQKQYIPGSLEHSNQASSLCWSLVATKSSTKILSKLRDWDVFQHFASDKPSLYFSYTDEKVELLFDMGMIHITEKRASQFLRRPSLRVKISQRLGEREFIEQWIVKDFTSLLTYLLFETKSIDQLKETVDALRWLVDRFSCYKLPLPHFDFAFRLQRNFCGMLNRVAYRSMCTREGNSMVTELMDLFYILQGGSWKGFIFGLMDGPYIPLNNIYTIFQLYKWGNDHQLELHLPTISSHSYRPLEYDSDLLSSFEEEERKAKALHLKPILNRLLFHHRQRHLYDLVD
jgi:hypothetical protein